MQRKEETLQARVGAHSVTDHERLGKGSLGGDDERATRPERDWSAESSSEYALAEAICTREGGSAPGVGGDRRDERTKP
jgi:hypothetical protein